MFKSNRNSNLIEELKVQRKIAMNSFTETNLVKNESLAEYFFCKIKEGKDVPFNILEVIPVGQALLLPVVYGGAIITTRQEPRTNRELVYNTKWTAGSTLTLHYHSDCREVIEVIEGKVKVFLEQGTYILSKGDTIEVSENTLHQVTALCESELKITFTKLRK